MTQIETTAEPTGDTDRVAGLRQEVRLGIILTGGVSLAVWMGGVARELNLLLGQGTPTTPEARQARDGYRRLTDLLDVDVSVDVLSGTSAGGINAAILGMANVLDVDIGRLRELWLSEGSLGRLLRDPSEKEVRSLLKGDDQLLTGLHRGFRQIAAGARPDGQRPHRPTDVFITTTLLDGLPSRFVDDYGTVVADRDHHGLFHFADGDLRDPAAPDRLALASRCTASFPAAFEAARLPIGGDADDLHPDMTGIANTFATGWVADGGILANRPIASAVRAVFDRPAEDEVRRLLLYVVPTSDGGGADPSADAAEEIPLLGASLLKDLGAAMSQAITGDLAGIRNHNDTVRVRRDTRDRLAGLARGRSLVTDRLYADYLQRTADRAARNLVEALLQRVEPVQIPLGDTDGAENPEAERAMPLESHVNGLVAALRAKLVDALPTWRTGEPLPVAGLGVPAAEAAMTTALQLVNQGYRARPDLPWRRRLAATRAAIHGALPATARATEVKPMIAAVLADRDVLSRPLDELADRLAHAWWAAQPDADTLQDGWNRIGKALADQLPNLRELLDGTASDLHGYVQSGDAGTGHAGTGDANATAIIQRLAALHVAETVLLPDGPPAEQELKLVQISADTATGLDPARATARTKLTGLQLHHFGAFYKSSWRANDWMWGRLDGAGWLVHVLLDPQRILARRDLDPDPSGYTRRFLDTLRRIAGREAPDHVATELAFLTAGGGPAPTSLPRTAIWVAAGLQEHIVAEELPCIAEQIELDRRAGSPPSAAATAFLEAERQPSPDAATRLRTCRVSSETFADEKTAPLLQYTVLRTAAVGVAALAGSGYVPPGLQKGLRPLARGLRWRSRRLGRRLEKGRGDPVEGFLLSRMIRRLGRARSARSG